MPKRRKQTLNRVLQGSAVVLFLLDVVLYLVVVRPLADKAAAEQQERNNLQREVREAQVRVERMKSVVASLPQADSELQAFLRDHVPSRRRGFSRASRLVRQLTEKTGLQISNVAYRLDTSGNSPLEHLGIDLTVEGALSGLLRFSHGLETADDFVVIRDFTFQPGEAGGLALKLSADLYLTP